MARNDLTHEIFSSGTTRLVDSADDFRRFQDVRFSTGYPGGLYLGASMLVPRDVVKAWLIKGAQRMRILNNQQVVFEGQIASLDRALRADAQAIEIHATGYWGSLLATRRLRRFYADMRTSPDVWPEMSGADEVVDTVNISRYDQEDGNNMLRILPQGGVDWGANDRIRIRYIAPAGETIRRMDFDFEFSEGSQNWSTKLQEVGDDETTYWYRNTSGSGSNQNIEPTDSPNAIDFFLTALSSQTTPTDVSVHSTLSNIVVYATMNHTPSGGKDVVNLTEIARDIRAEYSELSSDEDFIGSNTLSLVPFVAARFPTAADILSRAAAYGDASQGRWAIGVRGSHLSSDGKPILFAEQYPGLSDFDYAVRVDEANLVPPFDITEGYIGSDENSVWNWIIVEYADERGYSQFATPDDDANLKDQDSISEYGQRDYRLSIGHATEAVAVNAGRRFLEAHKNAVWNLKGPIMVRDHIRGSQGQRIPSSEIRAGKRLKIENFLRDPTKGSGDLIFLITKTDYRDRDQTCSMTVGIPNTLDVYLAQRELIDERLLG